MSSSASRPDPHPYPYKDESVALAVRRFFLQRVSIKDGCMTNDITDEMLHRVCDMIESAVTDRLWVYYNEKPRNEEMAFVFKPREGGGHYYLAEPAPIAKNLEYCFQPVHISIFYRGTGLVKTGPNLVLRVTPQLVTFAGQIVWQAPAK
jgi:hypothetical protein